MPRLPINTLHLVKRLQEAGVPPAQAEAQVEVLLELYTLQETATKSDLKKLRLLSKKDIAQTEARLQAEIDKVRLELRETEARLQAEIQKLQIDLRQTESHLKADIEKLRYEVETIRLEVEKLKISLQETEKRLLLNIQETEARLRTDILRSQVRIILWIAGLIAAQIPIFYLLRHFLLP